MPTNTEGQTDWSKIFMGAAIAIVFAFQGIAQVRSATHTAEITSIKVQQEHHQQIQAVHKSELEKLKEEAITIETVNAKLDKRFKDMINEMLLLQRETLELNKEWMQWQKDNAEPTAIPVPGMPTTPVEDQK